MKKETMLIIAIIVMGLLSIGVTYLFFNICEYGTLFKPSENVSIENSK